MSLNDKFLKNMSRQTLIIFSIFFIIALLGIIFIYLYRLEIDFLVKNYISKITICGNISDESDCYAKDFCEGIYGPSCPNCQDLEFKSCQRIPLKVVIQIERERKLCQQTGGEWYRNKLGNFCLCQKAGVDKIFDKTKGCISK